MAWQQKPKSPREVEFDETNTWTIKRDTRENKPEWSEFTGIINIEGKKYHLNPKRASDAQKPYGIIMHGRIKPVVDKRREDYEPVRKNVTLKPGSDWEKALGPEPPRWDPSADSDEDLPF